MYNKTRKQIKDQTRKSPGTAYVKNISGFSASEKHNVVSGQDSSGEEPNLGQKLKWERYSYSFRRIVGDVDIPYYVLGMGEDENSFWDYNGSEGISHQQIESNENGTTFDGGWQQYQNLCYVINLNQDGPSIRFDLEVELSSDCSLSVWTSNWVKDENGDLVTTDPSVVFQSLEDFPYNNNWKIPVYLSENGAKLWVYIYKKGSGGWAKIKTNIGARTYTGIVLNPPQWYTTPIVSSCNPETKNIENTLYFNLPETSYWNGIRVYRASSESLDYNVYDIQDGVEASNGIWFDFGDKTKVPTGVKTYIGDTENTIAGSVVVAGNQIRNGDFSWKTNDLVSDWQKTSEIEGSLLYRSTGYSDESYSLFNGQGYRMTSELSSTAKTYYLRTEDYLHVSTSENYCFNFYSKVISGSANGYVSVIYFDTSDAILDTHYEEVSSSYGWNRKTLNIGDRLSTSLPERMPSTTEKLKFAFYVSSSDTAPCDRVFDGISFYNSDSYRYFHTSSNDQVLMFTTASFESKYTNYTVFDCLLYSTTESFDDVYASQVLGTPQYRDDNFSHFENSIEISTWGKNYLQYGSFSTSLYWYGDLSVESTSDAMYLTSVGALSQSTSSSSNYLSQVAFGSFTSGESTSWSLSLFAKGNIGNEKMKMMISNGVDYDSSVFYLDNSWKRYCISTAFAGNDDSTACSVYFGFPEDYGGKTYFDGVQLEATSNPSPFIDYNLYPSSEPRSKQSIIYNSSEKLLSSTAGTIRFWYTPHCKSSDMKEQATMCFSTSYDTSPLYYSGIVYSPDDQRFGFRRYSLPSLLQSLVSTSFGSLDPIYIAATWNKEKQTLYVNLDKDTEEDYVDVDNIINHHIGEDYNSEYQCNGTISNFRIDRCCWSEKQIIKDREATKPTLSTGKSVSKDTYVHIGDRYKSGGDIEGPIEVVDKLSIDPNTIYKYCATTLDVNYNQSEMSSMEYIITPNINKDYFHRNKILNGSFEYIDDGKALGWSTSYPDAGSGGDVSSNKYFTGNNSLILDGTYSSEYSYCILDDTSGSKDYCLTGWFSTGNSLALLPVCLFSYYDKYFNYLGQDGLTLSFRESKSGLDGNSWSRYGYTYSTSNQSVKHLKLYPLTTIGRKCYLDDIQLEKDTVTSFSDNEFITNTNIPNEGIDGSMIAYNSLVVKHFYAGEIRIDSHTSSGNKIVIGKERTDSAFAVLTPNYFQFHPPGEALDVGWNYAKHIETGQGTFNTTYNFSYPFTDWYGEEVDPLFHIYPTRLKTYDIGSSANSQGVMITASVNPSYFNVKAKLYKDLGDYSGFKDQSIDFLYGKHEIATERVLNFHMFIMSTVSGYEDSTYDLSIGYDPLILNYDYRFGSTVLGTTSKENTGKLIDSFYYNSIKYNVSMDIKIYATSQASTAFPYTGTWWEVLSESTVFPSGITYFDLDIDHAKFSGAKSLGFELDTASGTNLFQEFNPGALYYSSSIPNPIYQETDQLYYHKYSKIIRHGSTTLPAASESSIGNLSGEVTTDDDYAFSIRVFATAQASTGFPYNGTWWQIAEKNLSGFVGSANIDIQIDHEKFEDALSIGLILSTPSIDMNVSFNPTSLNYSSSDVLSIIDYGATVGAFSWIALDGGLYGG
jgi:hypothetical protein